MQKQKTMRYQTSDYLDFDTATALVRKLYREEKYALSLLIGCGIFFGLRIGNLLSLRWELLLNENDKLNLFTILKLFKYPHWGKHLGQHLGQHWDNNQCLTPKKQINR